MAGKQINKLNTLLAYLEQCYENDENPLVLGKPKVDEKYGNTQMGLKISYKGDECPLTFGAKLITSKKIVEIKEEDDDGKSKPYLEFSEKDNPDLLRLCEILDHFWQKAVHELFIKKKLTPKDGKERKRKVFEENEECAGYDIKSIRKTHYTTHASIPNELKGKERTPMCRLEVPLDSDKKHFRFEIKQGFTRNAFVPTVDGEALNKYNAHKYILGKSELLCKVSFFGPMITNFGLSCKGRIWSPIRMKPGVDGAEDEEMLDDLASEFGLDVEEESEEQPSNNDNESNDNEPDDNPGEEDDENKSEDSNGSDDDLDEFLDG